MSLTTDTSVQAAPSRPRLRIAVRALGNVLIGLSLGLLFYYFATDLITRGAQESLLAEAAELGTVGAPSPDRVLDEPEPGATGWETWIEEDIAFWRGVGDHEVFGRLVIERMGLDAIVVRGVDREALKLGPGWMPYTDVPAQTGNVGIAAHRTTYGAPFRRLDELVPGDRVEFYSPFRRYVYEVQRQFTVTPDQVEVVRSTEEPTLTLSACHPPYSARYRLIVQATLVEMQRLDTDAGVPSAP